MNVYLHFLNYPLHKLSCTHLRAQYQIQFDKLLRKLREHARQLSQKIPHGQQYFFHEESKLSYAKEALYI